MKVISECLDWLSVFKGGNRPQIFLFQVVEKRRVISTRLYLLCSPKLLKRCHRTCVYIESLHEVSQQLPLISFAAERAPSPFFSFPSCSRQVFIYLPFTVCKRKCCFIARLPGESKEKGIGFVVLWEGRMMRQDDLGYLSLLRAVVICVPEEPCSHTALHGGRLGVCAGPDWAQVSSIVTWTLMQSVQFSQPLFVPTSVQPIRYPHCSHPMPLVGWGSLTSAVLLVFKHQLRKCSEGIS